MKKDFPAVFRGYFWDCNFSELSIKRHREFIIQRLLQYGGLKAMLWIKKHFHRTEIQAYLRKSGKKCLDTRSYEFWIKLTQVRGVWK